MEKGISGNERGSHISGCLSLATVLKHNLATVITINSSNMSVVQKISKTDSHSPLYRGF